jgi:hypothetical protein
VHNRRERAISRDNSRQKEVTTVSQPEALSVRARHQSPRFVSEAKERDGVSVQIDRHGGVVARGIQVNGKVNGVV